MPNPATDVMVGLRKRYHELGARIEQMKQEQNAIKARLRALGRGKHDVGDGKVTISPNIQFDPELAEKVLFELGGEDLVAKCSIPKVAATLTKQFVSGEVYKRCQKPAGEDKVTVS